VAQAQALPAACCIVQHAVHSFTASAASGASTAWLNQHPNSAEPPAAYLLAALLGHVDALLHLSGHILALQLVHRHRHILTHQVAVLQAGVQQQRYSWRCSFATTAAGGSSCHGEHSKYVQCKFNMACVASVFTYSWPGKA
jgi:hypothetical protein